MKSDARATYLKDEYLLLQKAYEDYDSRIITIKGWSATIGMAAIGAGFYQSRFLWLFAAGAAVVFWILEGLWKSFQYMNGPRIELIEEAFRTEQFDDVAPFQIYSSWWANFKTNGLQVPRSMFLGLIAFPHAITLVVGFDLFVVETLGWANFPRK
jgi:hypothetical protein